MTRAMLINVATGEVILGPEPPPDPAALLAEADRAVQAHVDGVARARQYRDGVHCASYATSTRADWAAEAAAFVHWRDAVWTLANTILAEVLAEVRPVPSIDDVLAELPAIAWPGEDLE
jgi:hypothetical protein